MTNADYTCTLNQLFLGDQETVTGWHRKGYTQAYILCPIFPRGTAVDLGTQGYYTQHKLTGLTEYDVKEGDVITDTFSKNYEVLAVNPCNNGDQFGFNELELEEIPNFSLPTSTDRFFGFEDTSVGTVGGGFEDGFERGIWTEVTY